MALREIDRGPDPPWQRPLAGSLDQLTVHTELLEDNPLGDPPVRPLYVYRPSRDLAESAGPMPSIYVLQGFGGRLREWLEPTASGPTMIEHLDVMFSPP